MACKWCYIPDIIYNHAIFIHLIPIYYIFIQSFLQGVQDHVHGYSIFILFL